MYSCMSAFDRACIAVLASSERVTDLHALADVQCPVPKDELDTNLLDLSNGPLKHCCSVGCQGPSPILQIIAERSRDEVSASFLTTLLRKRFVPPSSASFSACHYQGKKHKIFFSDFTSRSGAQVSVKECVQVMTTHPSLCAVQTWVLRRKI